MKKTITVTNGTIFTVAQVLFGEKNADNTVNFEGLINKKNLKTRIAVRQALKFNYSAISNAYKLISEMVTDITKELMDGFIEDGKAQKEDEKYLVKKEYHKEFFEEQQEKLDELAGQTVELDITTIPEKEYLAYAEQNDGELTDMELDVLEIFVEFENDKNDKEEKDNE